MNLKIFKTTSKQLRDEELKEVLPEFYALRTIIENGPWHNKQNTFDHAVAVFAGLENTLRFEFLDDNLRQKADQALDLPIGQHTRRDALILATILHDIAKPTTIIRNESTNTTSCPGHETLGSYIAGKISLRFGLDEKMRDRVVSIVRFHGFVHEILTLCLNRGKTAYYFDLLAEATDTDPLELLLFAYADMLGSDHKSQDANAFQKREALIISQIKNILSSTVA